MLSYVHDMEEEQIQLSTGHDSENFDLDKVFFWIMFIQNIVAGKLFTK